MTDASIGGSVPTTTRAVQFDHYGGLDVLQVREVDVTPPRAGRALIAVRAAGTNPGEIAIREGAMAEQFPATFPSGQGTDFAGVVIALGDGVDDLAIGEHVLGWTNRRASQRQHIVVPTSQLVPKPEQLSWEIAGSLNVAGVTAYAAVRAVAATPGDVVVVSGAAGGVGSLVVQLLGMAGAHVIGIASLPNHEWLRAHGVEPVSYGDGLVERLRAAAPAGVDAFIDTFGAGYLDTAAELGVPADRMETIIDFGGAARLGAHAEGSQDAQAADVLAELAGLAASGRLDVEIAATYPMDKVRAAYEQLALRHTRGKIVLIP